MCVCFCQSWEEYQWDCTYQEIGESKCSKSKKFSVGGKLSNVLPVNNSKQIIEETLINDISFFVSKKDLRSSPNEKKWD